MRELSINMAFRLVLDAGPGAARRMRRRVEAALLPVQVNQGHQRPVLPAEAPQHLLAGPTLGVLRGSRPARGGVADLHDRPMVDDEQHSRLNEQLSAMGAFLWGTP
jgi:hypothetical protein